MPQIFVEEFSSLSVPQYHFIAVSLREYRILKDSYEMLKCDKKVR
jgi:hypothetical protein